MEMAKDKGIEVLEVKDMTIGDLESLIEQKLLEILGDPDAGLRLNRRFRRKLEERLRKPGRRVAHEEVLKEFGQV